MSNQAQQPTVFGAVTSAVTASLSAVTNGGKSDKRFDYVVKTEAKLYVIETNYTIKLQYNCFNIPFFA